MRKQNNAKIIRLIKKLQSMNAFSSIEDPAASQRDIRQDGRDWRDLLDQGNEMVRHKDLTTENQVAERISKFKHEKKQQD